ncbi:MAG: helix-turn-helix domain protein [Bacteroidetes bacterium]|nr:helix-turn-helix domain protein [Bacteroidota bacterium]
MAKTIKKETKAPAKAKQLGQVNTDFMKLGKRMRDLRIKKGYKSFEAFAYDNEMSRVMYGSYEKGDGNITYKNLLKVVKALGVTITEFFSEGFD